MGFSTNNFPPIVKERFHSFIENRNDIHCYHTEEYKECLIQYAFKNKYSNRETVYSELGFVSESQIHNDPYLFLIYDDNGDVYVFKDLEQIWEDNYMYSLIAQT